MGIDKPAHDKAWPLVKKEMLRIGYSISDEDAGHITSSVIRAYEAAKASEQPGDLSDIHKVAIAIANTGLHGMPMEDCATCALAAINAMQKRESQQPDERLIHAERVMDALYHDLDNAVYSIWGCEAEHHRPATESDYQEYKRLWDIGRKGEVARMPERESLDECVRDILLENNPHGSTDYKAGFSSGLQAAIKVFLRRYGQP